MIPKYTTQGHACMHSVPPQHGGQHAANTYRTDIPDVGVHNKKASDNCYQFTTPTLLMYSRGGIPQDSPPDCMMSARPCGLCLHSLLPVSQSEFSIQSANQRSESD